MLARDFWYKRQKYKQSIYCLWCTMGLCIWLFSFSNDEIVTLITIKRSYLWLVQVHHKCKSLWLFAVHALNSRVYFSWFWINCNFRREFKVKWPGTTNTVFRLYLNSLTSIIHMLSQIEASTFSDIVLAIYISTMSGTIYKRLQSFKNRRYECWSTTLPDLA